MHPTCMAGSVASAPLLLPAPRQAAAFAAPRRQRTTQRRRSSTTVAGFGERLLDYIEGGPKLRKWYGQGERPADGGGLRRGADSSGPQDHFDENLPRDAVLVTDADTPTGEFVVLQLILARATIRVLVKNAQAASTSFGTYVTPIAGDVGNEIAVTKALRSARAVIVTGQVGPLLLRLAEAAKVEHLVLPSLAGGQQGAFGLFGADSVLRDPKREAAVAASAIPHTVVRAGKIKDAPGGASQLRFGGPGGGGGGGGGSGSDGGDISREDLARVLAGALECPPSDSLTFTVASDGPGSPPEDWQQTLTMLQSA